MPILEAMSLNLILHILRLSGIIVNLRFQAQYLIFEKMREEGYVSGTEDVRLTIEILVPSAQVGRIIGKGGQNVRELQRVTGSVIKLSEQQTATPAADEETTVHIIGPFFSVQVNKSKLWITYVCVYSHMNA